MELIIGGAYQGKTAYAAKEYDLGAEELFSCRGCTKPEELPFLKHALEAHSDRIKAIDDINSLVRTLREAGLDPLDALASNRHIWEDKLLIASDVSQGLVPLTPEDREYREDMGRVLAYLASEATAVTRVFCGLPQKLK